MRKLFLLVIAAIITLSIKAQYFQTGQDPASISWRQILTENFQLIYPDYFENKAQELAGMLEKVYRYKSNSLKHHPQKISVILHTQTVSSNGLVAWAPKRSEFYTTPHQRIYAQDWLQQLVIHEFRHVVQIDKLDRELPDLIKILLGEQGTAGIFGIYLPWWFIEGDAVVTETAMSRVGRGRFPSFLMETQAQLVEKGVHSYDKAYNGSLRDYIPNHYRMGYHLVGETRKKFGPDIWEKVLDNVGKKPLSLRPFNKALKKHTGFNKVQLYKSVYDSLRKAWTTQDAQYVDQRKKVLSKKGKVFTSYRFNHWLNDSTVVSYKMALDEIPAFVSLDANGRERKIGFPGTVFDESVNARGEWLAWSEKIPDLRWSHSGRSRIMLLNLRTYKKREVIPEFKAFAPAISPGYDKIITVESDFSSNYYLSVYDIYSGELVRRIQTEDNNYFFSPEWLNDHEVVAVELVREGKRLVKVNLDSGSVELLHDNDMGELKSIAVKGDIIYFTSSYSGKNSIYKMDLKDRSIFQVYEPRFGAEEVDVSPGGDQLVISDYTANGYQVILTNTLIEKPMPLKEVKKGDFSLAEHLASQESGVIDLSKTDDVIYESGKYSKAKHLLNVHSWAPVAIDPDAFNMAPGISIMSQDKLGTSFATVGYEWDTTEKTGKVFGKFEYKGWYPIFQMEINSGQRSSQYLLIEQYTNSQGEIVRQDTTLTDYIWRQSNFELNSRLPLNLSRGKYNRLLQPEVRLALSRYNSNNSAPEQFITGNISSLTYRLYYQQLLKRSAQDLYPDFGFAIEMSYYHSPDVNNHLGDMWMGQSQIYLPGAMKNHGFRVYTGAHKKNATSIRSFSDAIRYPRGWGKILSDKMYSLGIDYKLPLLYPEWSTFGLAYLKRINVSLFADFAYLEGDIVKNGYKEGRYTSEISSYGVELSGDMHLLRFYAPLNVGIRSSYLPEIDQLHFDLLLSINFTSL